MVASQFDSPATLKPDGTVTVSGGLDDSLAALPVVEVRFLLVQGDVVIQDSGQGSNDRWEGVAPSGQGTLQAGSVGGGRPGVRGQADPAARLPNHPLVRADQPDQPELGHRTRARHRAG
jgi:hypothetical protein